MPRPAEAAQQKGSDASPAPITGSASTTASTGGTTSPRKTSKTKPKKSLTRAPSTSGGLTGPKVSTSKPPSTEFEDEADNIWGGLDPSKTLLIHGLETDWIEEEMADDDDFRKDVLEQKVRKVVEEIGLTRRVAYKNLFRWKDGPLHNSVLPVLIEFREKKDRNELYGVCREGLKKTGYVITEDSRSRLGGQQVKPVSTKLNFGTFLEHYQAYSTAQVELRFNHHDFFFEGALQQDGSTTLNRSIIRGMRQDSHFSKFTVIHYLLSCCTPIHIKKSVLR